MRRRTHDELRWPRAALYSIVVVAPQLFGGIFAWGSLAISIASCMVLGWTLWLVRGQRRTARFAPEPLVLLALLMLGATILHALPLPWAVASTLAPAAVEHRLAAAAGLGEPLPRWIAFSLDPGSTHERILFGAAVLAALCAARLLVSRSRSTVLIRAVGISGLLVSASHLAHRLVDAEQIFGVYGPKPGQLRGPLLNSNNLAGFLSLTLPVCLGLAVQEKRSAARGAWLGAASVIAATALLARSRGGLVVLVAGPLLFTLLYLARATRHPSERGSEPAGGAARSSPIHRTPRLGAAVALPLATATALAALASDDVVDSDYRNLTKLAMYGEQLRLLLDDPRQMLLGVGRGGFSAGFAALQHGSVRAQHAESLPLQYAIEFGLPLALVLLGGTAARLWTSLRRWRSPAQLGAMVGVVAIAVHNLVDFSLELTGVAVPVAVCLGSGAAPSTSSRPRAPRAWGLWSTSVLSFALCLAAVPVFACSALQTDLAVVRPRLQAFFRNRDVDPFWELFKRSIRAHPADAELAGTAAAELVMEADPRAPFWLNRAMVLAPGWEVPHLWAAQWLLTRGNWDQGLAELSAAAAIDVRQASVVLCKWLQVAPVADTALRAAPHGSHRLAMLDRAAACLGPSEAAKVDDVIAAEEPKHVGAGVRRARRALARGDWIRAKDLAHSLQASLSDYSEPYRLEADALLGLDEPELAVRLLESALGRVGDRGVLLRALARARAQAHDAHGMRKAVELLRAEAAGDGRKVAAAMRLLSDEESRLGNHQRALAAMREAHRLTADPAFLAAAARMATALGQADYALRAWRELCRQDPSNPAQYCKAEQDVLRQIAPVD